MQTQPHTHHIPTNETPTAAADEWSQTKKAPRHADWLHNSH